MAHTLLRCLRQFTFLALAFFVLGFSPAAAADPWPELLGNEFALDEMPQGEGIVRARAVALNQALLTDTINALQAGETSATIALTLFPGVRALAHFDHVLRHGDAAYTLSGRLEGAPFGEIHLSVVDGALFASLNAAQGLFRLRSLDGARVEVFQLDPAAFPAEAEPRSTEPIHADGGTPLPDPLVGVTTTDDGSRIDVFVGYTDDARAHAGSTSAIQAMINTAISETNSGYASSLISQRVNLVGTAEYSYDETSFNWDTTLARWSGTADTYMDTVHTTRDSLNADEVVLVVHNSAYCGIGYLMHSDDVAPAWNPYGFALVSVDCLTGYYSLAHEMGHNMGAHHDRYSTGADQGAFDYAHGFWIWIPADNKYTYRTIMAYDVPSSYGYDSTRVNRWSNPYLTYAGQPTGKPTSDPASAYNTLALNNTAWAVARFRDGDSPPAPASLVITGLNATTAFVDWTDVSGEWLYRVERAVYGGIWSQVAQTNANVTSTSSTVTHSTTDYSFRVLSDNGNGRSASATVHLPAAPNNLALASLSVSSARLTWSDHSAIETGFIIEQAEIGTTAWAQIGTTGTNVTTFDVTSISTLKEYQYRVRAYSGSGYSMFTNTANGLPARPNSTSVSQVSMSRLRITWSDSSDTESGYRLERTLDGSGTWSLIANLPANTTTYDNVDLPCNTHYGYRLRAYNSVGNSDWSSNSGVHTAACGIPPSPSPLVVTTRSATQVQIHWNNIDGEDNYHVYRCNGVACTTAVLITTLPRNTSDYLVQGLTPGTTYYLGVRAHNAYGDSTAPIPVVTVTTLNFVALPLVLR